MKAISVLIPCYNEEENIKPISDAVVDLFNKEYALGNFNRLYSTNLTYVPSEYQKMPWFHSVDCSNRVAHIINHLHHGESIKSLLNGKEETVKKIKSLKRVKRA